MNLANYVNNLPGVPVVESPFFNELFDKSDPDYDVAVSLRENGFAVVDFPEPQLEAMIERIKANLHDSYDWSDWQEGRKADMRIMDAWHHDGDVRRIATNTAMRDLVSRLYGRQAFPFQTLNFPVGTQQHYHSDSVHFSSLPERFMCGVWVALEDIGPDQGPLLYYPGSHKWPIYTREHIGIRYDPETGRHQSTFEPLWQQLVEAHRIEPVRFHPRKGQALIWAANLLHGGDHHRDRSQTRWSQVTHYYFDDCAYYTPLASNEPEGEFYLRAPVDINTGTERPSSYLGAPIRKDRVSAGPQIVRKGFDEARYLQLNPDVAAAEINAWEHFVRFGRDENRPY